MRKWKIDLGQTLKVYRQDAGLSQKKLSQKLGYDTAQFVSNWERGVSMPPLKKLRKLAQLINMDHGFLFRHLIEIEKHKISKALWTKSSTEPRQSKK